MIRNVVAAFGALAGSVGLAATDAARPLIVFNDDVDVVRRAMRHANATNRCTKEMVERYYSRIVDGGKVTHLLMNVNSRCSGYPSKVAPNYWAALDEPEKDHPAGPRRLAPQVGGVLREESRKAQRENNLRGAVAGGHVAPAIGGLGAT